MPNVISIRRVLLAVALVIVSPPIFPFGTIIFLLSNVRIVVDNIFIESTIPLTPPASITSPTSNGRYARISNPWAKFERVPCRASPITKAAPPIIASMGLVLIPSTERDTTNPSTKIACRTKFTKNVRRRDDAPSTRERASPEILLRTRDSIHEAKRIQPNKTKRPTHRMPPCGESTQFFKTRKVACKL